MEEGEHALVDNLSHQKCVDLVPTHVYVAAMMIAGLIGNILVCRFYTRSGRATPTTRLIVAVAIIDTIVCVFMPKNIATMCLAFKSYGNWLCKLHVYFNHVTGASSIFVLVAIAIFRFRAVCRPFSRQFTLRHTNIVIMSLVLLSMTLSLPILFTYETATVDVKMNANVTATGYNCQSSNDPSQTVLIFAFNGAIFLIFLMSLVILFVIYSLIGIKIRKQYRMRNRLFASLASESAKGIYMSETSAESNTISNVETEKSVCERHRYTFDSRDVKTASGEAIARKDACEQGKDTLPYEKAEYANVNASSMKNSSAKPVTLITTGENEKSEHCNVTASSMIDASAIPSASNMQGENEKTEHANVTDPSMNDASNIPAIVIRQVLMLFIITLVFIISSLPYLAISIYAAFSKFKDEDKYTNWYQFCYKSYLINSAINPFVYGFFNTEFRHFVKNRCLCRKTD